jgi:hypothetical protein
MAPGPQGQERTRVLWERLRRPYRASAGSRAAAQTSAGACQSPSTRRRMAVAATASAGEPFDERSGHILCVRS